TGHAWALRRQNWVARYPTAERRQPVSSARRAEQRRPLGEGVNPGAFIVEQEGGGLLASALQSHPREARRAPKARACKAAGTPRSSHRMIFGTVAQLSGTLSESQRRNRVAYRRAARAVAR